MNWREIETTRRHLGAPVGRYYGYALTRELFRRGRFFLRRRLRRGEFISVNLETTAYCNRTCPFCFNHPRFPPRERGLMPTDLFHHLVAELAALKFSGRLSLYFYGEPLLDRRLPEWMRHLREKLPQAYLHLATNGDLLNEELFLTLIRAGMERFFITDYEKEEQPHLIRLREKYPFHVELRRIEEARLTDRAGMIFGRGRELARPCLRPASQLVINWRGEVLLCCHDFYGRYKMGQVGEKSLKEIWHSPGFRHYRELLAQGQRFRLPLCRHCDDTGAVAF
jgi:cyclic pyranopterin phosphate synthase